MVPATRHHEVQAFVARGLTDFSISRSRARARGWGIPVPGDADQVMYVWFDALTNYVTALGYAGDAAPYRAFWRDNPHRVHVIGKDILRFHAVYWPAMLLSAGAPLPSTILVHGFLTRAGRRMSKTLGTGVDPTALTRSWGVDTVRYWLLREVPPAGDADYTDAGLERTYHTDLANDLGNLVQRTVSMVHRYRAGAVPALETGATTALREVASELPRAFHGAFVEGWDPRLALDGIFALVRRANHTVADTRPWALAAAGDAATRRRLDGVLAELTECLRLVAEALRPFLPDTAARMAAQLGIAAAPVWREALEWGRGQAGLRCAAPEPLFPRRMVAGS